MAHSKATAISGVSLAESGETFTATLADANGLLAATGVGVSGSGTTSLSIAGSLAQVNADLAQLLDRSGHTITVNASDGLGGHATPAIIAVTVDPGPTADNAHLYIAPSQSFDLTKPLLALDTPGLPGDTLTLTAVGTSGTEGTVTLNTTNGDLSYTAPASGNTDAFTYTVSDQLGDNATGNVSVTLQKALLKDDTISLTGSGDIVDAGNGNDQVSLQQQHRRARRRQRHPVAVGQQ